MHLIVGLGNPEPEYSNTRHNMGFDIINKISDKYNISVDKKGFKSLYGIGEIEGKKVILAKPQTFMNLSGEAVIELINFYKIDYSNVIIIYDDFDIEPGQVKIRKKGGAGSHNGMKSVINSLGRDDFIHIRIGTGKPIYKNDSINYVIGKVSKDEYEILLRGIEIGEQAIKLILEKNVDKAMNLINTKK